MSAHAYFALRWVHIFAMALWTGGPIAVGVAISRLRRGGDDGARWIAPLLTTLTKLFVVSALTTVLSGVALVELAGGFRSMPWRINVGAALSLVVFSVGGTVIRPTILKLEKHYAEHQSFADATSLLARFSFAHRAEIVLRFIILALMVLKL